MAPMVGTLSRADLSNYYLHPTLVVRVIEDEDVASGRSTGLVGAIRDDLDPIEYTTSKGPIGGTLELQMRDALYIQGDRDEEEIENWENKTITLELRERENNRALQTVLFRGKVAGIEGTLNAENNNVTLHCRDYWYVLSDAPVEMPTQGLTLGTILQSFVQGFYYRVRATDDGPRRVPVYFPQHPIPHARDGTALASIDPELLSSPILVGNVSLSGQSLAEAFCSLIEVAFGGDRIPDLEYDSRGRVILTTRLRGERTFDLVVGNPGVYGTSERRMCRVQSITGTTDYSRIRNRFVGEAAPIRVVEPMRLEKGWTDAEEAAVRAVPELNHTERYHHVFRRFRAPKSFWSMVAGARGVGDSSQFNDQMVFWQFVDLPSEGISEPPLPVYPAWEIRRERTDGDLAGTVIDDLTDVHPENAKQLAIYFEDAQRYDYYTTAQRAAMAVNQDPGPMNATSYQFDLEASQIGERPILDTGIIGAALSRPRTAFIRNDQAVRVIHRKRYRLNDAGERVEILEPTETPRNDLPVFAQQLQLQAEANSRAKADISVVMMRFEPERRLGDRAARILSNTNRVLHRDLPWYVESARHDLTTWTTTLPMSAAVGSVGEVY